MKRCPNPTCSHVERLPGIDVCRKCGVPLVDDGLPPSPYSSFDPHWIITVAVLALLIAGFMVLVAYLGSINGMQVSPWYQRLARWYEGVTTPALNDRSMEEASAPMPEIDKTGTIKIGLAVPLSGDEAASGEMILCGAKLMVDNVNESGGIEGRRLELIVTDHQCDPRETAAAFRELSLDSQVRAIISDTCCASVIDSLPMDSSDGPVIITPTILKYKKGWSGSFFQISNTDLLLGEFLAEYAREIARIKSAAILHDDARCSVDVKDAFVKGAKENRIAVLFEEAYSPGTTDFTEALTEIRRLSPDCILIVGSAREGGLILVQAEKMGIKTILLGAGDLADPEIILNAGIAANGLIVASPFLCQAEGDEGRDFEELFKKKCSFGPNWMAAKAYDAVGIIVDAIKQCGADRGMIRDCLKKMSSRRNGYGGVTGTIFFNEGGPYLPGYRLYYVKNGRFVRYEDN